MRIEDTQVGGTHGLKWDFIWRVSCLGGQGGRKFTIFEGSKEHP